MGRELVGYNINAGNPYKRLFTQMNTEREGIQTTYTQTKNTRYGERIGGVHYKCWKPLLKAPYTNECTHMRTHNCKAYDLKRRAVFTFEDFIRPISEKRFQNTETKGGPFSLERN